jgi:hypothetical protein
VTALVLWGVLTLLGVETMAAVENDPRWKAAVLLFSLQTGCLVVSLTSSALLRWAGYRMVKSPKASASA